MTSGIYIIQNGDQLLELEEKEYDSELVLQKLLTRASRPASRQTD